MSWFLRSVIRKGTLYCLCLLMWRWICRILIIGYPICLLYPWIGIGVSSFSKGVFKKLASFIAYLVLIKVKVFALELAKVEVKTWYLLWNKVQGIVQLLPPISRLRLTYNISIPFNPREESSPKVPLFLTLYCSPKLLKSHLFLLLLGSPL